MENLISYDEIFGGDYFDYFRNNISSTPRRGDSKIFEELKKALYSEDYTIDQLKGEFDEDGSFRNTLKKKFDEIIKGFKINDNDVNSDYLKEYYRNNNNDNKVKYLFYLNDTYCSDLNGEPTNVFFWGELFEEDRLKDILEKAESELKKNN